MIFRFGEKSVASAAGYLSVIKSDYRGLWHPLYYNLGLAVVNERLK